MSSHCDHLAVVGVLYTGMNVGGCDMGMDAFSSTAAQ